MAMIATGDFALAVRCGDSWGLYPAGEAPEAGHYAVSVKVGDGLAAFKANKPEVDQYALAIRQGGEWVLAGLPPEEETEDPEIAICEYVRNPLCSGIPCFGMYGRIDIAKKYKVSFSGATGELSAINGTKNFVWFDNDCVWMCDDGDWIFYFYFTAGPDTWILYGSRKSDGKTFSYGTNASGGSIGAASYEPECNWFYPLYNGGFNLGPDGTMGQAKIHAPNGHSSFPPEHDTLGTCLK